MQQSMYSAMFGALTQEHRMNIIANNLANVNTTGYKRDRMAFKDVFIHYAHDDIREPLMNLKSKPMFPEPDYYAKPRIATSQIEFDQGSLKQTGNDLDLALAGPGFFKVRNPLGREYYTRNGSFSLNSEGMIINGAGDALLGEGGPITVPEASKLLINNAGQIFANGEQVETIAMTDIDNPKALQKVGHNYFELKAPGAAQEVPVAPETRLEQGYLEAPNVEVVTEMVNMIETHRAFEAYQKVISNTKDTDSKAINEVGSVK